MVLASMLDVLAWGHFRLFNLSYHSQHWWAGKDAYFLPLSRRWLMQDTSLEECIFLIRIECGVKPSRWLWIMASFGMGWIWLSHITANLTSCKALQRTTLYCPPISFASLTKWLWLWRFTFCISQPALMSEASITPSRPLPESLVF